MKITSFFLSIFLLPVFLCGTPLFCQSEEVFDQNLEKLALSNIRQLTNPFMGFERAGEA